MFLVFVDSLKPCSSAIPQAKPGLRFFHCLVARLILLSWNLCWTRYRLFCRPICCCLGQFLDDNSCFYLGFLVFTCLWHVVISYFCDLFVFLSPLSRLCLYLSPLDDYLSPYWCFAFRVRNFFLSVRFLYFKFLSVWLLLLIAYWVSIYIYCHFIVFRAVYFCIESASRSSGLCRLSPLFASMTFAFYCSQ